MTLSIKKRIANGQTCIGSWLSLGSLETAEMMTQAGFDWLALDMEHTGLDYGAALDLIRVIDQAGVSPMVRVGANDPFMIKRALDAGAEGLIIPMVNTRQEAEAAVRAASYPPVGDRGVGLFRAQKYGLDFQNYKNWINENLFIAVQIEHRIAVENLEEILSVDGIDAFFIGPYDLSGSYGYPGEFDHPVVKESLKEIRRVVESGVRPVSGIHVVEPEVDKFNQALADGYKFVAFASDMLILSHSLKTACPEIGLKPNRQEQWTSE